MQKQTEQTSTIFSFVFIDSINVFSRLISMQISLLKENDPTETADSADEH